jgi:hypothetical protein
MGNSSDSLLPKAGHVTEFACRPALKLNAPINWRALCEPLDQNQDRLRELVRHQ